MMTETANKNISETVHSVQTPLADIYETSDIYSVKLEMPGVAKENLNIVIENDELKITADTTAEQNDSDLKYAEFVLKKYSRTFRIGNDIDRNKIDAKLENGILSLTLHKSEEVKPKKILINQIN